MNIIPLHRSVTTRTLFIARETKYVRVSGGPAIYLAPGSPLRAVVRSLADLHRERPLGGLSVEELFDAAWPGKILGPHVSAGRVYHAICKLRRMGLGQVLSRADAGYRLDPRCCVIEESPVVSRIAS